jgi:phosphate transport system substrate-binding protein
VKIHRYGRLTGVALLGALALTACGTDSNGGTTAGSGGSSSSTCPSGTIAAEGSTAQKNAIEQVVTGYQDQCSSVTINYNPTGSGAGVKQFIAGQVDFAGSDSALSTEAKDGVVEQDAADKTCGSPAWNLPMVVGPIAVAYNVKGLDKLVLTPEVTAKIFNGVITKWNDPAIAAINSGVSLPKTDIKVFFRSDESGTTQNFTKYLNAAAPDAWPAAPAKVWSGKGEGKPKSDGVSAAVKSTDGGIAYVEWSYAQQNSLGIAQIDNGGGPVELTAENVGKAIEAAQIVGTGNDLKMKIDYTTKAPGAYPIDLVTYEIVCSKAKDATKGALVKAFLTYFSSTDVQSTLTKVGSAPLPASVQAKVSAAVAALS